MVDSPCIDLFIKMPRLEYRVLTKYVNSVPDPKMFPFFENDQCFRIVPSIRFQRALYDIPIMLQTQIIPIFVFWAPNAQIWKFSPDPQIFAFF